MILSMSGQAVTFLHLVLAGVAGALCYDVIRALRRAVCHRMWLVQLEDTVFWLVFALFIMLVMLWENNAQLRLFSLLAPLLGAVLYFCVVSPFVMRILTAVALCLKHIVVTVAGVILHIICSPFVLIGRLMSVPIRKMKNLLYKFNKIVKKLLKKLLKCATIDNVSKGLCYKLSFLRVGKLKGSDGIGKCKRDCKRSCKRKRR